MHELSIVMSIVDLAERKAKEHDAKSISRIDLDIGTIAGIEFDSLEFVWEAGVRSTILENAERVINKIQAEAKCLECNELYSLKQIFEACPNCGSYFNVLLKGKELRIKSLIIN
jgi:hydrogenase nickel incorporation protein HypA/HybF